ncbi:hypothetical protein E2C01_086107 [Portunus trituberculatus]|uniref:Uncharacterized protein n=1 Tax=Portunus trituberculatus TaxID=210409 RepID=A0A5B7J4K4_PORTR|nr:hypothetical protein [Portunus trituberculatus]
MKLVRVSDPFPHIPLPPSRCFSHPRQHPTKKPVTGFHQIHLLPNARLALAQSSSTPACVPRPSPVPATQPISQCCSKYSCHKLH